VIIGRGRVNKGDIGGWIWLIRFIYLYADRTMKPAEIVLSRWSGNEGEW
jgi:hypothetical protein